ncbi:MAG: signal peptidase I [Leptolyngbyaceae cyanobacterium]
MFSLNFSDSDPNPMLSGCILLDGGRSLDVCRWLWLWLVRRRQRFQVADHSMLPLLKPGDEVLVDRNAYGIAGTLKPSQRPQPNDIVVIDHPHRPGFRMVKRVKVMPDGAIANLEGAIANLEGAIANLEGAIANSDGAIANSDGAIANSDGAIANSDGAIANSDTGYWVEGDNTLVSIDSRRFGPVPHRCLMGKVVCIFRER